MKIAQKFFFLEMISVLRQSYLLGIYFLLDHGTRGGISAHTVKLALHLSGAFL